MRQRELMMASWLLRRPEVLQFQGRRIKEVTFGYDTSKLIMEKIWDSVDTHGQPPSMDEIEHYVLQHASAQGWGALQQTQLAEDLEILKKTEVTDVTGREVSDCIIALEKNRLAQEILQGTPEDFRGKLTDYRLLLDDMGDLDRQEQQDGLGVTPFSKKHRRKCIEKMHETYTKYCLPFGIPKLDHRFLGGCRPKEVTLIQAGTNVGKTTFMLNLAHNFAFQSKKRGVYFALDNDEVDLYERIFAILTGDEITGTMESPEAFEARIDAHMPEGCEENITFRIWDPDDRSMSEIAAYLRKYKDYWWKRDKDEGIRPECDWGRIDWVIVDYLDAVKPQQTRKEYRHELKELVNGAKRIGNAFECPVYLATQGNRAGMTAEVPGLEHMAEAIGKAFPANHVLILHQSESQESLPQPEIDIAVAKARRPLKKYIVRCWINTGNQRIWENFEAEVRPLRRNEKPGAKKKNPLGYRDAHNPNQGGAPPPRIYGQDRSKVGLTLGAFNPSEIPRDPPSPEAVPDHVVSGSGTVFRPLTSNSEFRG